MWRSTSTPSSDNPAVGAERHITGDATEDLKIGKFTHADAGQMHLYLNYAREHWTHAEENPPVGLILCSKKDEAVAHYALEGLPSKVLAAEYRTALPTEKKLVEELRRTQVALDHQIDKEPRKPDKKKR